MAPTFTFGIIQSLQQICSTEQFSDWIQWQCLRSFRTLPRMCSRFECKTFQISVGLFANLKCCMLRYPSRTSSILWAVQYRMLIFIFLCWLALVQALWILFGAHLIPEQSSHTATNRTSRSVPITASSTTSISSCQIQSTIQAAAVLTIICTSKLRFL